MNVTRFCVSVRPFVQGKQYALTTSVTPILSSQKRYQLKIDNRRILGQIYPAIVPKYSKRYGEERLPETAKRRVREVEVTHIDFEQSAKKAPVLLKELGDFTSAERLLEVEAHLTLSNELDRLTTKEVSLNALSEWNRDQTIIDIQLSEQKTFTRERTESIHLSEQRSFERIEPFVLIDENKFSLFDSTGEPLTVDIAAFEELVRQNEKNFTDAILGADEKAIRYDLSDVRLLEVEEIRKADNEINAVLSRSEGFLLLRRLLQNILLDGMEESTLVNRTVYEHIFDLFSRITRLEELSSQSWEQSERIPEINDAIEDDCEDVNAKTDIPCDAEIYNDFCISDLTRDIIDGQLDLIEKADRDLMEIAAPIPYTQEAKISQKEQLAVIENDEAAAAANRMFDATDTNGHAASRSEQTADVESRDLEEASSTATVVDADAETFDIEELTRSQTKNAYMPAAEDIATLIQQIETVALVNDIDDFSLVRGVIKTILDESIGQGTFKGRYVYEHIFDLFSRITRLEELSSQSWEQSERIPEINDAIEDDWETVNAKTDIPCDAEIYNDFCISDLTRDIVDGQLDLIEKADRDLLIETAASIPLQEAEVSQKEQLAVIEEDEIAAAANRTFDATDINGHDASRSEQAEDVESKGLEEASPTSAVVDVDATTFDIEELTRSQTEDVYMLAANDVATLLQQAKELSLINGIDNFSLVRDVIKAILDESIGQGTFKGRYVYEHIIELFQRIDNEPYESSMMHSELVQKISETVQAMLNNHEAAEVQRQLQSAVIEMTSEMSRSVNVELIDETLYSSADKNKKEVLVASEQLNDADRSASEQIIFCEKTEPVDQALSEWNAELQEVEQATNQWLVIEADLNPHEMARIKEVMYQAGFAGYETFERMMEQAVSLDQLEASGRELEKDIVLSHFVFAEHDVIENVIMANFNEAIRDILEIVYVDEIEDSDIIQKKKKRIWLIPAKPNFYSGWTWKKTR
ncbi:hypothetical protein [Parageobacillus thermoglucosidasius]|uniref:hypothetical protein n=1 Tax=Parageobacillus thermoglucosidasius TaxID=1426 RepID=UPI002E1E445A|nr:hypothetical protein [Parageobacillus thermoglucosidasius]MED4946509.1 hypothetical protein [Parageobacillus thermoglucosidasius]MED4984070.1 hypothetical protein [Parageobacillus thermoglucosidasius]